MSIGRPSPFLWLGGPVVAVLVLALPRATRGWLHGKKVQDVMATSVTSIDASASLMEAAEMMRHANVGVLSVVGPDGKCARPDWSLAEPMERMAEGGVAALRPLRVTAEVAHGAEVPPVPR